MSDIHTPFGVLEAEDARELLRSPSDVLDQEILAYSNRWHVVGIFLRCVSCGESQKASGSTRPFPHGPGCRASSADGDFPWRELAEILRQLPR